MSHQRLIFINRFYYPDFSATSKVLSAITERLSSPDSTDNRYQIMVLCSRHSYDNETLYTLSEQYKNIHIQRIRGTGFGRASKLRIFDYLSFYWFLIFAMLKHCKKNDIIICKTDPPMSVVLAAFIKKIKHFQLVSWNQDIFPEVAKSLSKSKIFAIFYNMLIKLRNYAWRQCDWQIAISDPMAEYINTHSKHKDNKALAMIYNASEDLFPQINDNLKNELQQQLGFSTKDFIIAYFGNAGYAHEIQTMLEVMTYYKESETIKFLMVGGGSKHQHLKAECQKRKLQHVYFQPYCSNESLASFMDIADVHWLSLLHNQRQFVFPSKFASICSIKKPIIYIGNVQDSMAIWLKKYHAGKAFNIGDETAIIEFIEGIENDQNELKKQGGNAYDLYQLHFTFDDAITKWHKLLSKISTKL